MVKMIAFDQEARDAMRRGVSKLSKAVRVTLGPRGRNVILQKSFGSPTVTKDGVTVAKEVDLEDVYENMGARMVREVASKTSDVAGDGTTIATILAEAIFNEGLRAVVAGVNPIQLRRNPHGVTVDGPHYNLVLGKTVLTRNGLANLDPRALPGILEQARSRFDELKKKKQKKRPNNELLMITLRDRRSQNSWIHNCPSMMKNRKSNIARMNTKDAERLGIARDDRIRVKNKLGQIELPVKVTDNIMAGVIVVPHGWGHNPKAGWKTAAATSGVNSNLLCDDQVLERPSGHPLMNGIPVQVSKVS